MFVGKKTLSIVKLPILPMLNYRIKKKSKSKFQKVILWILTNVS